MPFSAKAADRAVNFFERILVHIDGEWAGQPFILMPWQKERIIRPLFGTLRPDGYRQYRTCYVEIPRKSGKSETAAGIALYLLLADGEAGAQVYGAAGDKDQASLVFRVAGEMTRRSPYLSSRAKVIDSTKRIIIQENASFYRAIPADAAGAHGFNAHGIIVDEVHVQPDRTLIDVLTTSTGARRQPLTFLITTAGYDRHSVCWSYHDYALKVASGVIDDPTFLPVIYAAGDDDDWTSPATWRKANPSLGVTVSEEFLASECARAEEVPAFENVFRRLYLNQWTQQDTRWLAMSSWDQCAVAVELEDLAGRPCYAGLDLASTTDIAALVLAFPIETDETLDADIDDEQEEASDDEESDDDEAEERRPVSTADYAILPFFWIPGENIAARVRRDRVPYDVWVREGYIYATEGNVIHYAAIRQKIDELARTYDLREVGFDRWGATQMTQELQDAGMEVVPIGQGFASMTAPTKELLNLVLAKRIKHGGNPVLRWMADNLRVTQDPAGNLKPDKAKSTERVDGIVAMIMSLDRASRNTNHASAYESRGLLVL